MNLSIPRLGHIQRKEYLEEHYGTQTNIELSLACGVHVSTIKRDISEWKLSGEYDEWLDQKWHQYLESPDTTIPAIEKFRALTRLKEKRRSKPRDPYMPGRTIIRYQVEYIGDNRHT